MRLAYRRNRGRLSFRAVNRRGTPEHDPALQRHHLLPRQLFKQACFRTMFGVLGPARIGFDDFRRNGLLLPAREDAVRRLGLPLHRGPHPDYNAMVIERVGGIERCWAQHSGRDADRAVRIALIRLERLQRELRNHLLDATRPLQLNRGDPLGAGIDFSGLDAMAGVLWSATD